MNALWAAWHTSTIEIIFGYKKKVMNCSTAGAEQKAAQEALSVSEHELQRIKQMGCFTTSQDQAIMRNPDYRALPYPAPSNPLLSLEFDTNNKYTAINQAEGFTSPFVNEATNQVVQARPTVPGLSMAGTGDLAAIAGAYLDLESDQKSRVYSRIADSIRGASSDENEFEPTRQGLSEVALRKSEVEQFYPAQMQPTTSASQVTAPVLYGDGQKKAAIVMTGPTQQYSPETFLSRCKAQCRAALYDLMHYDSIGQEQIDESKCSSRFGYISSREGRLPYLLFVLTALFLVSYTGMLLVRRR